MQNNTSFTMLEHSCVVARLQQELRCALGEFRDCPGDFIKGTFARSNRRTRRTGLLEFGFAFALLVYSIGFALMVVLSLSTGPRRRGSGNTQLQVTWPLLNPRLDLGRSSKDAGGGGGGGDNTQTPASAGGIPAPSLTPMVAPKPEDQAHPPVLPMIEEVMLDPRISPSRDDSIPTGIPGGVVGPPSAGPGLNGGIGAGRDGGIGDDSGPGVGPGFGGNTRGGAFQIGTHRRAFPSQPAVDTRPVLLNHPRPYYTEEARLNKVQGVVKVRILVSATGEVSEVVVTRGLPDGLSEQAIRAAYQMRFSPAQRAGRTVPYWITNVEIEFNLR